MTGRPPRSEVYLHGHHDSVLRSHRWRTAENSAAYLLARLPAASEDGWFLIPHGEVLGRV
jgi:hypothetical protein